MDHVDRQIVALLSLNGRRSNVQIARELGVSEGTIRKRIDRLLSDGALRIVGIVDPQSAGCGTQALVYLDVDLAHAKAIDQTLVALPQVASVYWVTGEHDFIVDVIVESDAQLMGVLTDKIASIPGVQNTQVAHVLRSSKQSHQWSLPKPPSAKILIVDDDPDFCEVTRTVLEHDGFVSETAHSGREAVQAIAASPPDLVVLDIMMDGVLDGWNTGGEIRSNPDWHDIPILVVSSITASDYLSMLPTDEDYLIDNFLSKPVSAKKLVQEVNRLLRR